MTLSKKKEIIKWMCKHWKNEDVLDDAITKFGASEDIVKFCTEVSIKIEKECANIHKYFEKKIKI